jgi:16S rRNA (guanine527-N7)-methyltransferase
MRSELAAALSQSELVLTAAQLDTLSAFAEGLLEKNRVMNLTAITEPLAVAQLHFADCLSLLRFADFSGAEVIDIGCGAGFPGVPLKIACPSMHLTLLDSLGKRIRWLRDEMLPSLSVEAQCIEGRAEEQLCGRRETYDYCLSRAVARLDILCELCLPYVKPGGMFLAMKGALATQETREAAHAISLLGGKVERCCEYPVADAVHTVVLVRKCSPTPAQYPRRYAKIKQQPL